MRREDWILLIFLSLLWGGSFLFVEIALTGLPTVSVVFGRVTLAALILGAACWARGIRLPRAALAPILLLGLVNCALPFSLLALGQGGIDGALAAIVNATTPLWTVIVAHLFTADERITPAKAAGLFFGFAGVVVMAGGASGGEALSILSCLGATLCYGIGGVFGRRFGRMGLPPLAIACGQVTAASLILLPVWLLVDRPFSLPVPGSGPLLAVGAMAALSTALAYLIYFRLLATAGATNLSLVTFLIPVSAAGMGALWLGEVLLPRHLAGFALIAAGLIAMDGRMLKWLQKRNAAPQRET